MLMGVLLAVFLSSNGKPVLVIAYLNVKTYFKIPTTTQTINYFAYETKGELFTRLRCH